MTTGTGLDTQLGFKFESTWGTPVVVDKFVEYDSESLKWEPSWIEPTGLRVGIKAKRASRLVKSRESVSGDVNLQFGTRTMGSLLKAMFGSTVTTPTLVLGSAYKQVHNPGDFLTKSLTLQVGRPEPSTGTVRAHTFEGMKVTAWEFSVSDGATAQLKLTFDGQTELTATALATASYVSSGVFSFADVTVFKLGGAASGVTELSVAGGTDAIAAGVIVKGFTLKGTTPFAAERFGLGNTGQKVEQLENDTPTWTGTLDAEYQQAQLYTPFKANTTTAVELKLENSIISGSDKNTIHIVLPAVKFKTGAPNVSGPGVVEMSTDFEVYNDEVNSTLMFKIISADSAAL